MGLFVAIKGFLLGLSLIVPIGSQNSMLLTQGANKDYHLFTASLFIIYDVLLITLGVLGGGLLLTSSALFFNLVTWGGIVFLGGYGAMSFKNAIFYYRQKNDIFYQKKSLKVIILISLAVTFLNPMAYIDTIVVIGSVGGQYTDDIQIYFIVGTIFSSVVWFLTLAIGAAKLSPQLNKPTVKCIIDVLIGMIMWGIAWTLFSAWLVKY